MYYVNKIVGMMMSPCVMGLVVLAALIALHAKRRYFWIVLGLFWFWMSAIPGRILGLPLEREWLVNGEIPTAESFPAADAIVCLGGGMSAAVHEAHGANMFLSADRVWMAAQLWKAGKAPKVVCTGTDCEASTRKLLLDFGVSSNALVFLEAPRNTEEEAKRVQGLMFDVRGSVPDFKPQTSNVKLDGSRPRVLEEELPAARALVVTSAWHMRRAKLMFEKYAPGVEVVPAATDFEATIGFDGGFGLRELQPNAYCMWLNEAYLREWIGYFGYKWLR